ncbi:MAG: fatty acid desaturase, partial [Flavobacteriales bacterium]|nr:fatty acid desaturase [Flavobacteriales bacterium]
QVVTTTDFGRGRKWVSFVFGGFNLHLCHHLFPGINHTRYDMITPVISEYLLSKGMPYTNNGVRQALISHWKLLRKNAADPRDLFAD